MSRLGGVVNKTLDDLGLRSRVLEQQAVNRWAEVVGPQIASSSTAQRVQDGVLFVGCKSSMWANELALHKDQIVKRLNKAVGREVIKDIRFSARGFKKPQAPSKEASMGASKSLEAIQLREEDINIARSAASSAPSAELAERIEKAILTSKRLAELKRREVDEEGREK